MRTRRQKIFNIAGMLRVVPTGTERTRAEVGEGRMTRPEAGVGEGARKPWRLSEGLELYPGGS